MTRVSCLRPGLGSEAGHAAPLRPPRHLPVRLCGLHAPVRGQVTRGVPGGHRGPEEGQEPPRGREVHPAVVHHGVTLVREVVGLTVVALGHVLADALPKQNASSVCEPTTASYLR